MKQIVDKNKCCGCEACRQICPVQCISMEPDKEDFYYPQIGEKRCIDCKRCTEVCPVLQ